MIMEGRGISPGYATGRVLKLDEPFSFLGGVDPATGELTGGRDRSLKGSIFVFPRGKGSTVGSYVMFDMKARGTLPRGIVNDDAEPIVATGTVMSDIPMVDRIDTSLIRDGDIVELDGEEGTIDLKGVDERSMVMSIVKKGQEFLLVKEGGRGTGGGTAPFRDTWSGIWGPKREGESPLDAGMRTIEERGQELEAIYSSRTGRPVFFRDKNIIWKIHPLLLEFSESVSITFDQPFEYRWIQPRGIDELDLTPTVRKVLDNLQPWQP